MGPFLRHRLFFFWIGCCCLIFMTSSLLFLLEAFNNCNNVFDGVGFFLWKTVVCLSFWYFCNLLKGQWLLESGSLKAWRLSQCILCFLTRNMKYKDLFFLGKQKHILTSKLIDYKWDFYARKKYDKQYNAITWKCMDGSFNLQFFHLCGLFIRALGREADFLGQLPIKSGV